MGLIKSFFTWWDGATWGTRLFTLRRGEQVGSDAQGNRYYRERGGSRRWVMYQGEVEASRVPPEWHAWLHHTVADTPVVRPPVVQAWEQPHEANLTGSAQAYHPPGSLQAGGVRARATGDYGAWVPPVTAKGAVV